MHSNLDSQPRLPCLLCTFLHNWFLLRQNHLTVDCGFSFPLKNAIIGQTEYPHIHGCAGLEIQRSSTPLGVCVAAERCLMNFVSHRLVMLHLPFVVESHTRHCIKRETRRTSYNLLGLRIPWEFSMFVEQTQGELVRHSQTNRLGAVVQSALTFFDQVVDDGLSSRRRAAGWAGHVVSEKWKVEATRLVG